MVQVFRLMKLSFVQQYLTSVERQFIEVEACILWSFTIKVYVLELLVLQYLHIFPGCM